MLPKYYWNGVEEEEEEVGLEKKGNGRKRNEVDENGNVCVFCNRVQNYMCSGHESDLNKKVRKFLKR